MRTVLIDEAVELAERIKAGKVTPEEARVALALLAGDDPGHLGPAADVLEEVQRRG